MLRVTLLNPLKLAALTVSNSAYCIDGFCMILNVNSGYFLEQRYQFIFVMVKCCVFFAVRTEFLNVI
jgi:hypothetical protein